MKSIKLHKILLTLLFFIAFGLRFYNLSKTPPSLNWDEVSHGYNAYSILKTGKDEWGKPLPVIFKAYGDYKLPVYIYFTSLSEFFFGITPFAVRLPSALAGIGTLIFTYLLVIKLFHKKFYRSELVPYRLLAIITLLLVTVEPWSLFLSRAGFEANLSLFFIVSGVYFFIEAISQTKTYLLVSIFLMGLSVWTYNSARIFVPLLIIILILLFKKELLAIFRKEKKLFTACFLLFAFLFIPMFIQLINPVGQARYGKVSIIDEGAISQIIKARLNSTYPPVLVRLIYNRPIYFLKRFLVNWVSHFSFSFLFFEGGNNYQFNVPNHGLLYWINLPFFLLGLFWILRNTLKKDRVSIFLLSWLFLAPIPSSLTREAPHTLRAITMLPVPMIVTSLGFLKINNYFNKKSLVFKTLMYGILVLGFSTLYLIKYFGDYNKKYSWSWQYGYKEVVAYVRKNFDKYDKIVVTKRYGEPHEFFLFFWSWDPEDFINDENLTRFYQSNWYWVDSFNKFYFINDWEISENNTFGITRSVTDRDIFKLESGKLVDFSLLQHKC